MNAWEGKKTLSEENKARFRECLRFKKGQQAFGVIMNKFRTKRTMVITDEVALHDMADLIKFSFDEIMYSDVWLVMQLMYLASTLYYQVAPGKKVFLNSLISDHPLWMN